MKYQGAVRPGDDEAYFRKTGITRPRQSAKAYHKEVMTRLPKVKAESFAPKGYHSLKGKSIFKVLAGGGR